MLSTIGYKTIIFDRSEKTEEFEKYVKKIYLYSLISLSDGNYNENIVIIDNKLLDLKKVVFEKCPIF